MEIKKEIDLKPFNTFGLSAKAHHFVQISSEDQLKAILHNHQYPIKILGGGSNILLTQDIDALVLKNEIRGIDIISEDEEQVLVRVGAGEGWHDFVLWTIENGYGGLENLSLIPGSVGAAPMQNIGAYGVEQNMAFDHLEAIDVKTLEKKFFDKASCHFGYRESIFKNELRNQYFITQVCYRLTKSNHLLHLNYGAINDVLEQNNIKNPTIADVSSAVIHIRKSKLPDPKVIGNAGSFFKNPVISATQFAELSSKYKSIPHYTQPNDEVKVPAGWLIEQAGYKGKRIGNIGIHKDQALVLVNYGGGKGNEIWKIALEIQATVLSQFGIKISPEVNIWP